MASLHLIPSLSVAVDVSVSLEIPSLMQDEVRGLDGISPVPSTFLLGLPLLI